MSRTKSRFPRRFSQDAARISGVVPKCNRKFRALQNGPEGKKGSRSALFQVSSFEFQVFRLWEPSLMRPCISRGQAQAKEFFRVKVLSAPTYREMKMRACGSACCTTQADFLPRFDVIP